ncbi:hypothetical protein EDC04DRAFT_3095687 [Pisolithus marmoratus]|nr:hypothetical protein EDC04DRAFT_3095687 [Pisolithus marmoratus]
MVAQLFESLLREYGAGQTPQTNKERDVVAAWKTADDAWHQWATMAYQYIIFGLPDSILMLLQLAIQAPSRTRNPPSSEEGSPDSPNDCAKTESKYLTPEIEVVDMQQVEDNLPEVEVGAVDMEQPNKCTNVLEVPDEKGQHMDEVVAWPDKCAKMLEVPNKSRDLLDTTSECAETKSGHMKPKTKAATRYE